MMKQYLLGFLLLFTASIGMMPNGVFANEPIDNDGDGVPNAVDQCPHLLEDYDPEYGNNIDGCPADLFHGMMLIMMVFKIILMTVLL